MRAHSRALARIFKLGKAGGKRNAARCYDNISSWACDAPILRCAAKTHKAVGPGGIPKARPICGATKSITTAIGETLSDILEPLTRATEEEDNVVVCNLRRNY